MKNSLALLAMTLLLAACATPASITHQVQTPPPSSPMTTFSVEKALVQSRETGDDAWRRNDEIAQKLLAAVRAALQARGKTLATPAENTVRVRVYAAYGDAPVRTRDAIKGKAHLEIRLEVVDTRSSAVRYSTFTIAPIREGLLAGMGVGEQSDELIQNAIDDAAQDFASRL